MASRGGSSWSATPNATLGPTRLPTARAQRALLSPRQETGPLSPRARPSILGFLSSERSLPPLHWLQSSPFTWPVCECVCVCECELEFMSPFSCSSVNRGALGTTQRRRQTKRQVFACCFGERLLLWLPWRWLTLRMYKSGSVKFRGICESVCSLGTFSFSSIVEIQGNASVFNVFFFLLTFATKTTMSVCLPMGNLLHSTQHHPLRKRNSQGLGKWH